MDPNDQIGSSGDPSAVPQKRKRGRPRKDPSQKHSGRSQIPPGFEAAQQYSPQATTVAPDPLIGQAVNGVIEASFDGGYLLSLKIGNSDDRLRGVVFKPGQYVPVTAENDIAPQIPMIIREGGVFPTVNQSSSRGQKLAVQRAGMKNKQNQTQSNDVPVVHQPENFQVGFGLVENNDKDVHMVEPLSMLPPDRIVPVAQLFSAVQTHSNPQGSEDGSMNDGTSSEDGQAEKLKSKPVTSASADTTESSHFLDVNIDGGKPASKSSGDSGIVFSKQDIGTFDVPLSKDSGVVSNQEAGNADAPGNVNLIMNFSANPSETVNVAAPFLTFAAGRMTDLLQAVQETVKDATLDVAEQPPSVSHVDLPQTTMASETDDLRKAIDP